VEVKAFLEERIREGMIPGASWAVLQHGRTLNAGAVGCARLVPSRRPADESTVYDLSSLTKPLATAALAVLLAREGVASLDEPVVERLPELAGSPYARATLLDLLSHRSGLPAWEPLYLQGSALPAFLRRMAALPPAGERRGSVVYSDLGYIAARAMLERAAGRSLEALFARWILEPLRGSPSAGEGDLPEVRFHPPGKWLDRIAPTERDDATERRMAAQLLGEAAPAAYRGWRKGIVHGRVLDHNAHALGGAAGHAGLFGTAAGVATLGCQFLPGSRLFENDELTLFVTSQTPGREEERSVGFLLTAGGRTAAGTALSPRAVGHVGFTGTSLFVDPETAGVFVLLTNRVHPEAREIEMKALRRGFHQAAAALVAP
jgi:CubicO group peptidase (beta-lactamase class C family)